MKRVFVLFYSFCLIKDSKRLPSRNSTDKTKTVSWHHLPNWIWLSSESTEIEFQLFQVKHVYLGIQRTVDQKRQKQKDSLLRKINLERILNAHISLSVVKFRVGIICNVAYDLFPPEWNLNVWAVFWPRPSKYGGFLRPPATICHH